MADQIYAEIGANVGDQFPSASNLCSWAALVQVTTRLREKENLVNQKGK